MAGSGEQHFGAGASRCLPRGPSIRPTAPCSPEKPSTPTGLGAEGGVKPKPTITVSTHTGSSGQQLGGTAGAVGRAKRLRWDPTGLGVAGQPWDTQRGMRRPETCTASQTSACCSFSTDICFLGINGISKVLFCFEDFIYLYLTEKEKAQAGSPMWDSIPGPRDHRLSPRRTLHRWSPPRTPGISKF